MMGDLVIEGERIATVGGRTPVRPGDSVLDATDMYVMPGVIDPHTHFALRSGPYTTADDFATGTRAAACGGVTTIIDYTTQPRETSLVEAVRQRRAQADGQVCIDYGLHAVVADLEHGQMEELPSIVQMGIPSVKVFTTYRGAGLYSDDLTIFQLLKRSRDIGLLVTVHAENDAIVEGTRAMLIRQGRASPAYHGQSRPALAEIEAVNRLIFLAQAAGSAVYFVHLTTPEAVTLVTTARQRDQPVIAESCPQYLVLDDSAFAGPHPEEFICSPPIRSAATVTSLCERFKAGEIQVIGTDHCGFTGAQKRQATSFLDAANGLPGVETSLPVLYSRFVAAGEMPIRQLARVLATNPARAFGLYPRKGALRPGSDADVVVYDPRGEYTLRDDSLHGAPGCYTPYAGRTIYGRVAATISRGQVVYRDGRFLGRPGHGRFVAGRPFDPTVVIREA
jgi:dihydropyrimidinase